MTAKSLFKNPTFLGWAIPTVVTMAVYLSTTCRTVYVGDSGEFSLVMKTLGIAHPPGYPLFTLAGHGFVALLGFLKPALAANLFGALLAVTVIPALFYLLEGGKLPFITGALTLLWAYSPTYWGESTAIEVYALNLIFVATLGALALSQYRRKWFIVAYLLGLSLAHHLSVMAVIPGLVYLYFSETKKADRWKHVPVYLLLIVLGLSIYLYLPARASRSPLADWGHPTALNLLINHITAAQYQYAVAFSLSNLAQSVRLFFSILLSSWWWIGIGLVIWGGYHGWKVYRQRTIFALTILMFNLLLSAFYRIPDIDPYYLPGLFACWLLMAQGVLGLASKVKIKGQHLAYGITVCATLLLVINYRNSDRSGIRIGEEYGRLILDTATEGTVFTSDDNASFTALYMRYAEGYRPQVEVYDRSLRAQSLMVEAARISGQTIYKYSQALDIYLRQVRGDKYLEDLQTAPGHQPLQPYGVLYAAQVPHRPAPTIPSLWQGAPPRDFKALMILVNLDLDRAEQLMTQSPPDSFQARQSLQRAFDLLEKESRATVHNNMGIALRHLGVEDLALACYDRALRAPRLSASEREEIIFNTSNIYKDRGNRLAQGGDYSGAVAAFTKALDYDPENDRVAYNIGVIYVNHLNQPQAALPYLERYLAKNPGDENVGKLVRELKGR